MDAVKAFMERSRMCKSHYGCEDCPLNGKCGSCVDSLKDAKEALDIVEKWSKEHPVVTNGLKVYEMIPANERSTAFKEADSSLKGCGLITSEDYVEMRIRRSWWDAEYKEEDNK